MALKIGSLAHFERFLDKGNRPWEYVKAFESSGMSHEKVDKIQEKRLQRSEEAVSLFMPNDNTSDDWFPAPGFETDGKKKEIEG
ncbi:MAG: hypothetical protein U1D31_03445 [Patescibacteria group bacterium]|nr:hypothetical protein [bacterium]MDZ4241146.1 hypothetical protein [Patescibacteria group bacterium]